MKHPIANSPPSDGSSVDSRSEAQSGPSSGSLAPTIAPVEDVPGRGEIPEVSLHSAAVPLLYALDHQPMEEVSPGLRRRYLNGTHSTFVEWTAEAGAEVPLHHHPNEQITWITKGSCEVLSQGKKYLVKAGEIMIIPPNTPHAFRFLEDTVDIDIFMPQRQDWTERR